MRNHHDETTTAVPFAYYSHSAPSTSSQEAEGTLSSQFHAAIFDSEFLLRCTLTHDWDTATSFCQFLEEIFTLSVPDRRIKWQKHRIAAAHHQLVATDQWGNTALHAACFNTPPARVVQALLQAASAVSPRPLQIHLTKSRDESTPLLVACATGASLAVIQALLDPPAGLERGGSVVACADQQGCTPLSELAVHYELQRKSPTHHASSLPLDQVQLISRNPTSSRSRQDTLLDSFQAKLQVLLQAAWVHDNYYYFGGGGGGSVHHPHNYPNNHNQPFAQPQQQQQQQQLCNNHNASIKAAARNHTATTMISLVHGLAHVAASCPPVVTRLVVRGYPHMISFTDRHGILPLHLALLTAQHSNENSHTQYHRQSQVISRRRQRHACCIQELVQAYPASARMVIPQTKGRTPLLQAIASGWFWHTSIPSSTSHNTVNDIIDNYTKGPVQILYEAAPQALAQIDPVTGLYPVLLAATTFTNNNNHNQDDETTILQVDTIYNLLGLNPQVLQEELSRQQCLV